MKRQLSVKHILGGLLTAVVVLSSFGAVAQKNLTLYGLSNTPQSLLLNPAFKPDYRIYVGFPVGMQNISVMNTGFRLSDALETRSQDDSLEINPQLAIDKMGKINYVNIESCSSLFGFGIRLGKNYFSFDVTARTQFRFTYPKDLFQFAVNGNGGANLGQRLALDGIAIDGLYYAEYAFGFNRPLTEKLTIGGRFKLLSGIANVKTKESRLGISTDETTFDITVDGQASVNTSNVSPFYDTTYVGDYNPVPAAWNFGNSGVGIDAGVTYQLNEKVRLDASVLDFGFIRWKTNVSNYQTNDFNFTFRGINFDQSTVDSSAAVDRLLDSLQSAFGNEETHEAYTTSLYTRFLLGGQVEMSKFFSVGAVLYNEFAASRYSPGLSLSGTVRAGRWFQATMSYSMYGRSYGNIGLALAMRPGPVQFYISTDNIFGALNPVGAKYIQAAFGMNVLIGHSDGEDKPKKSKKAKKEKSDKGDKSGS